MRPNPSMTFTEQSLAAALGKVQSLHDMSVELIAQCVFANPASSPDAEKGVDVGTPSSKWKTAGEQDPHGDRYDCERAALAMGSMTDDELANGVFMHGNEPLNIEALMSGKPGYHPPIAWLTAAKDRIRWLSRLAGVNQQAGSGVPSVQISGHLDEIDAPTWEFINAEARKLGPQKGSIDTYNFSRPNGSQPNGGVAALWNGNKLHALAVTVRDAHNRTVCARVLAAPLPPSSAAKAVTSE